VQLNEKYTTSLPHGSTAKFPVSGV
jgi:hypothetical protein